MEKALDFIKKHRFDIIVTSAVIAFCYDVFISKHIFSITIIAVYAFGYATDNERSKNNIAERKKLLPKGLVEEDIKNIAFVKRWEETRKNGLVKYAIVNGGIFFGLVLCFILSILALLFITGMMKYIMAAPANMFNFIGYTYIAGLIAGTILYRLSWLRNEKKFIRLTDPLHPTHFSPFV